MSHIGHGGLLVAIWLLAWGTISVANVLSGIALAAVLLLVFPSGQKPLARVRPFGMLRLVGYVAATLPRANLLVAREILSPRRQVRTGVIAHPVADADEGLLSLIANVIALAPGTMTVEVTRDPDVIYIHFVLLGDVDRTRASITTLERFCRNALGGRAPSPAPRRSGGAR